jgi:tetratricopeptide (TPR) repeat protein
MGAVVLLVLSLLGCMLPAAGWAQQPSLTQALDFERRGDYIAAVAAYRAVLRVKPADPSALLGLERSLLPLNRSQELLPVIGTALKAAPTNPAVYGIALRAWAAADQPDSVRSIAERWARIAPTDDTPYREWGAAELGRQNREGAKVAYLRGRARLGRPDALAAELAQMALAEGDYSAALREWLLAVRRLPGYRGTAVSTLGQAPEAIRPELIRALESETDPVARRLEAELRARWGDPLGGMRTLMAALPADQVQSIAVLRAFLEQVRGVQTSDARLVQGRVLEAMAERMPEGQAARLRLEAAQAYSLAGDRGAARRMLTGLANNRTTPASVSSGAGATLVSVLITEGKLDEAEQRLTELRRAVSADEFDLLRRKLVVAMIHEGELRRADSTIRADSSVEGLALSGRVRLYLGDIKGAIERFKAAGPYTGDRSETTHRTALLALLQPLEIDTFPQLGRALLLLEQGDTAQAGTALEQVAADLPPQRGGAELNLLAGHLFSAAGRSVEAERVFRAADVKEAPSTAPAAELALAELLLSSRRPEQAVELLEHLILTYPQSALVPQARRKLDEARGAVPKT